MFSSPRISLIFSAALSVSNTIGPSSCCDGGASFLISVSVLPAATDIGSPFCGPFESDKSIFDPGQPANRRIGQGTEVRPAWVGAESWNDGKALPCGGFQPQPLAKRRPL